MDFRHLIVTCLFSKLRLPFDNQKVKENYAIFLNKRLGILILYVTYIFVVDTFFLLPNLFFTFLSFFMAI